jgi:hypothetical protein
MPTRAHVLMKMVRGFQLSAFSFLFSHEMSMRLRRTLMHENS